MNHSYKLYQVKTARLNCYKDGQLRSGTIYLKTQLKLTVFNNLNLRLDFTLMSVITIIVVIMISILLPIVILLSIHSFFS